MGDIERMPDADATQPLGWSRPMGQIGRFLALGAAGVVALLAGLGVDTALHARDPDLAANEGVLTLTNPGHALFLGGVVLAVAGLSGAGWTLLATRRAALGRHLGRGARVAALAVTALLATAASGLAAELSLGDGGHDHQAAAATAGHQPAGQHGNLADVAAASQAQRAQAQRLLDQSVAATRRYRDPALARQAGYRVDVSQLQAGKARFLHAGSKAARDDGRVLDPERPESLIYAKAPDGTILLVGVLYTAPKGEQARLEVAGPVTHAHTHVACLDQQTMRKQGVAKDGTCPDGQVARESQEMMHVWFTDDLSTAFARRAPLQDLLDWQKAQGTLRPA
jgi:hypothetical protein